MDTDRKPRDDEIDAFGLSHRGKVRPENQDHFLLASIHKRLRILQSNLPDDHGIDTEEQRVAFLGMVADGVGGSTGGREASATAIRVATQYVAMTTDCFMRADPAGESFIEQLQDAALRSHDEVRARRKALAEGRSAATTLTLLLGVWPWYYVLQVGDSRHYLFRDGVLSQVTRDQTMAQELVDQGVMTRAIAAKSRFSSVLSSAIGSDEAVPVVTRLRSDWGNVHLMCSDGLTKHVSDERIAEVLRDMTSARQAAEALLEEALADGGTDNVTIIVGRTVRRD
jgi:serine/threonine protein phosphatase PrpC